MAGALPQVDGGAIFLLMTMQIEAERWVGPQLDRTRSMRRWWRDGRPRLVCIIDGLDLACRQRGTEDFHALDFTREVEPCVGRPKVTFAFRLQRAITICTLAVQFTFPILVMLLAIP